MTATTTSNPLLRILVALVTLTLVTTLAIVAAGEQSRASTEDRAPGVGLDGSAGSGGLGVETDPASKDVPVTEPAVGASGSTGSGLAYPDTAMSSGWAYPMPYYGGTEGPLGVTAYGQAYMEGSSEEIRDEAIRMAVADARRQAEVAAEAAGGSLGAVVAINVSAAPIVEPLPGAEGGGEDGQGGSRPGSPGPPEPTIDRECPPDRPCPVPVETWVSVTVTWELA